MPIPLFYNRQRYNLLSNLTKGEDLFKFTLKDLKSEASQTLNVPYNQVQLICCGALMKDDHSSLASYGINERSKLLMVPIKNQEPSAYQFEDKTEVPAQPVTPTLEPTNSSWNQTNYEQRFEKEISQKIDKIQTETYQKVQGTLTNYSNLVVKFQTEFPTPNYDHPNYLSTRKALEDKYLVCNETLLKGLLKLDGISTNPNLDTMTVELANVVKRLREKRKKAVTFLQQCSDQMDTQFNQIQNSYPNLR